MYRASLTTAARRASHRLWRADLAHACANHPRYPYRGDAQTTPATTTGHRVCCEAPGPGSGESGAPPQIDTTATVAERRDPPSGAIVGLFVSAAGAGMMLGCDLTPVSGALLGGSLGVAVLSFLEISSVRRT